MTELILNREHYTRLVMEEVPAAKKFLWLMPSFLLPRQHNWH